MTTPTPTAGLGWPEPDEITRHPVSGPTVSGLGWPDDEQEEDR